MSFRQMTPAQQRGINEGDWCEVVVNTNRFLQGTKVCLLQDDESDVPWFNDDPSKPPAILHLDQIRKLEQQDTPDLQTAFDHLDKAFEQQETPAQERGIKVGDGCEVIEDCIFESGIKVYLVKDTGDEFPWFSPNSMNEPSDIETHTLSLDKVHKLEENAKSLRYLKRTINKLDEAISEVENYHYYGGYKAKTTFYYRKLCDTRKYLIQALTDHNRND